MRHEKCLFRDCFLFFFIFFFLFFFLFLFLHPQNWTMLVKLNPLTLEIRENFLRYSLNIFSLVSLERRWSSRTFRYGYLVTTSPQSSIPPSTASSLLLDYRLRVLPTPMVWRAVCTRPGNVFTAACWSAITSNSDFMQASFSLQSELGQFLGICSISLFCFPLLIAIVVRV